MATLTAQNANEGPRLDSDRWRPENVVIRRDRHADMLYVYALPIVPSGGVYVGPHDEMLMLVSVDGDEIVGAQIENFQSVWLKLHPEVQASFRQATRPILSRIIGTAWMNFRRVMINSVTQEMRLVDGHARLS